jgi:hypothetical protein
MRRETGIEIGDQGHARVGEHSLAPDNLAVAFLDISRPAAVRGIQLLRHILRGLPQ